MINAAQLPDGFNSAAGSSFKAVNGRSTLKPPHKPFAVIGIHAATER